MTRDGELNMEVVKMFGWAVKETDMAKAATK